MTNKKLKQHMLLVGLALASIILMLALCAFGSVHLSLGEVLDAAMYRYFFVGEKVKNNAAIVNLRLLRTVLAYLTGAALSVSGAGMQAVFGNPLADPHIMGVSSGAALGAAVATVFGLQTTLFSIGAVSIFAFIGGLLAALVVMLLSRINGRAGTTSMLLSGVAMGAFLSAMLSGLLALNRESAEAVYMWTMGSFTAASVEKITVLFFTLLAGFTALMCLNKELNLLLLGEKEALSLGTNVRAVRLIVLALATLLTAVAVSFTGVIGFVGLMAPHAARRICGPDHKRLLPVCMMLGGIFMMVVDTLARSMMSVEIPVGVLTSLLGGPFFLYMIRRGKRAGRRKKM